MKRYSIVEENRKPNCAIMMEIENGEWVRYKDFKEERWQLKSEVEGETYKLKRYKDANR